METKTLDNPLLAQRPARSGVSPERWSPLPFAGHVMADGAEHLDPALWDSLFEAVQLRVLHIADEPVADATPLRSFAAVRPPQAAAECCAALRYLHQVVALERHAHLMTRQRAGVLELLLVEARRRLDGVVRFERNHALASCNVLFSNQAVSQSASCALCR